MSIYLETNILPPLQTLFHTFNLFSRKKSIKQPIYISPSIYTYIYISSTYIRPVFHTIGREKIENKRVLETPATDLLLRDLCIRRQMGGERRKKERKGKKKERIVKREKRKRKLGNRREGNTREEEEEIEEKEEERMRKKNKEKVGT